MSDALGIIVNSASGSNGSTITIVDYGTFEKIPYSYADRYGYARLTSTVSGQNTGLISNNDTARVTLSGAYVFAIVQLTSSRSGYAYGGYGGLGFGLPNATVTCPAWLSENGTMSSGSIGTVTFTDTEVQLHTPYGLDGAYGNWYIFG